MSQTEFCAALLNAQIPVPKGLIGPQGRPAGKRFDVYRNNVAIGLTAALEAGFPVLRKLLGVEFFTAMAGVFLREHPPTSRIMMLYGTEMPVFISNFAPVAHLPYLPDIARLELALRQSYHAKDHAALTQDRVATLPPDRLMVMRVEFAPAVKLLQSNWPVHGIWRANMETDVSNPVMQAEAVLVTRPDFDPIPQLLLPQTAVFIAALMAGKTLEIAAEIAGQDHDLALSFALLLQGGAITDLHEERL